MTKSKCEYSGCHFQYSIVVRPAVARCRDRSPDTFGPQPNILCNTFFCLSNRSCYLIRIVCCKQLFGWTDEQPVFHTTGQQNTTGSSIFLISHCRYSHATQFYQNSFQIQTITTQSHGPWSTIVCRRSQDNGKQQQFDVSDKQSSRDQRKQTPPRSEGLEHGREHMSPGPLSLECAFTSIKL